jgi:hypothetical protein
MGRFVQIRLRSWLVMGALLLALPAFSRAADTDTGGDCAVPGASPTSRPAPDRGPTQVRVGLYTADIATVDDVTQSFTADIRVEARWQDPRLSMHSRGSSLETCKILLDQVWHPALHVFNQRSIEPRLENVVGIDSEGNVVYVQRFFGAFSSPMDLSDFPYDRQELKVQIVAAGYSPDEISFEIDPARTGRLEDITNSEWRIGAGEARAEPLEIPAAGVTLARVGYVIAAERNTGYYFWKVIVPLTLIVLMAWAVFWIDPSELSTQVSLSATAVLTLIAFQLSLNNFLPRISYLTRLDRFILGASLLVFLALGEAVAVCWLARYGRESLSKRIDQWSRWLFLMALILVCAVSFWL